MASHPLTASVSAELQTSAQQNQTQYYNNNYYEQTVSMHSYDEVSSASGSRNRRASPVSSAGQAAHGVVSSSTSRDDHSPLPQCSSSSYPCHTFQGDEIENSEESEYFSPSTPGGGNGGNNGTSSFRYQRTSTPNGRERKRVLR